MDIYDVAAAIEADDEGKEIVEAVRTGAQRVAAKIADSLSRSDRRIARDLMYDAVGLVAVTHTELAVAWGRGLFNDETFKQLDDKYAALTVALQQFK